MELPVIHNSSSDPKTNVPVKSTENPPKENAENPKEEHVEMPKKTKERKSVKECVDGCGKALEKNRFLCLAITIFVVLVVVILLISGLVSLVNVASFDDELVISDDVDCHKLFDIHWNSVIVNENRCNHVQSYLSITDNVCLKKLVIRKNALNNLLSFVVSDNKNLNLIIVENGDNTTLDHVKTVEFSGKSLFPFVSRSSQAHNSIYR